MGTRMEQTDAEHLSLLTKRYDLFALALSIKVQQPVSWCHSICARARTYARTLARYRNQIGLDRGGGGGGRA